MGQNPYETSSYLADYLLLHYGQPRDTSPLGIIPRKALQFHQRIFKECVLPLRFAAPVRGLDIGCGVGRFTFELSRVTNYTLGIDSSETFIEAAQHMVRSHCLTITVKESGADFSSLKVTLPEALQKTTVAFQVGDAQDLTAFPDNSFHIVAAINLICRLPNPRQFLSQLHRLIVPEGQLILASPFTWLEEFTPPSQWLNSRHVEDLLKPHFRRISRKNVPFVIREHRRKYQLVISEVSAFVRQSG